MSRDNGGTPGTRQCIKCKRWYLPSFGAYFVGEGFICFTCQRNLGWTRPKGENDGML
jgi:hypothetical protein